MMGQCFCGRVAFAFDGPTSNIEICHCTRCQRATGSPFAAEFRVRRDNFRWLRGEELVAHFDAPVLREPPGYRRSFCTTCGAAVPSVFDGNPTVAIPTGLIEDNLPVCAVDHIWIEKRASWLDLDALGALPQYAREPAPNDVQQQQRYLGALTI